MKPLATNQRVLTSKWEKRLYVALVLTFFVNILTVFVASFLYAVKFMSIDLQKSINGFGQLNAAIAMTISVFDKIPPIFEKL